MPLETRAVKIRLNQPKNYRRLFAGEQEKLIMENSQLIKGLRTNLEAIEINNSGKIENAINVIFKGMEICLVGEINKKRKSRLLKEKKI